MLQHRENGFRKTVKRPQAQEIYSLKRTETKTMYNNGEITQCRLKQRLGLERLLSMVGLRQLRNCSGKPPSLGATVAAVHPVKSFGENNAAGDSLIIAWVLMAEVMGDMLTLYGSWEQAGVRRDHQVAAQCAHLAAAAVFIAFGPPIVLQGLGAQLKASKFVALWAWFVLVLNAFGILIMTLFTAGLSPLLVGEVHLLLLFINLVSSGGLVPAPMLPPFYNIRMGLPFGHAVSGARTILFGSHNRLRTNAAVLAAWTAACYCMAACRAWLARSQLRAAQATAPDGADMF
jgi:hypothetical protein